MRVLVLGSGGREHAIAWKCAASRCVEQVFIGPGNAGTENAGVNLPGVDPLRFDTVIGACRANRVDCVFVGPEVPLAAGVVDALSGAGIPAVGPARAPAQLESSKAFSKAFLLRNALPTAQGREFTDVDAFARFVRGRPPGKLVVKKSGLAAGKGVLESADTEEILSFGSAVLKGDQLIVEEFLTGWEVSIFGLSDGRAHVVLPPCTDFKKAHDGDAGPNTGGMGSICPVPWVDEAMMRRIGSEVIEPTYAALDREGLGYAGVLFFGLMITAQGPKILEYNVRFGDPETQVLLPMLGLDMGELIQAMATGSLGRLAARPGTSVQAARPGAARPGTSVQAARPGAAEASVQTARQGAGNALPGAALGVVVASRGYPEHAEKGARVEQLPPPNADAVLFHASTVKAPDGAVLTGGGRCFTAVGTGADLAEASRKAYAAAEAVRFDGAWFRRDIGKRFMDSPAPPPLPRREGNQ
jgi:phosphoribosylamine---glycine ligase